MAKPPVQAPGDGNRPEGNHGGVSRRSFRDMVLGTTTEAVTRPQVDLIAHKFERFVFPTSAQQIAELGRGGVCGISQGNGPGRRLANTALEPGTFLPKTAARDLGDGHTLSLVWRK